MSLAKAVWNNNGIAGMTPAQLAYNEVLRLYDELQWGRTTLGHGNGAVVRQQNLPPGVQLLCKRRSVEVIHNGTVITQKISPTTMEKVQWIYRAIVCAAQLEIPLAEWVQVAACRSGDMVSLVFSPDGYQPGRRERKRLVHIDVHHAVVPAGRNTQESPPQWQEFDAAEERMGFCGLSNMQVQDGEKRYCTSYHEKLRYIPTVPGLNWFQRWYDDGAMHIGGPFETQLLAWQFNRGKKHPVGIPYQSPYLSGEYPDADMRRTYGLPEPR